jgi:hypothetical protein
MPADGPEPPAATPAPNTCTPQQCGSSSSSSTFEVSRMRQPQVNNLLVLSNQCRLKATTHLQQPWLAARRARQRGEGCLECGKHVEVAHGITPVCVLCVMRRWVGGVTNGWFG